jgi:hypothetical protein
MAKKSPGEARRARSMRLSIRGQDLVERLQMYALGEIEEDDAPSKNQLDVAKFLLDRVMPAYKDPPPKPVLADQSAGGPQRVFVLQWDGGQDAAILLAQRERPVAALPAPIDVTPQAQP